MQDTVAGALAEHVLSGLASVAIDEDPFPHLILRDAVPPDYFRRLVTQLPPADAFAPAGYPGTGAFTSWHGGQPTPAQTVQHHGLVLRDWSAAPLLAPVHEIFASDAFARALLDRFSDSRLRHGVGAIPSAKHALFKNGRRHYSCVFSLHKDPAGYEISPHVDNPAKIITFLWYIQDDESPSGTLLCRPRRGVNPGALARLDYEAARRDGRAGLWAAWDNFDVVKEVYGPNVLFAFAPNEISFHGVIVPSHRQAERIVLRGFVARRGYRDTTLLETPAADGMRPPA